MKIFTRALLPLCCMPGIASAYNPRGLAPNPEMGFLIYLIIGLVVVGVIAGVISNIKNHGNEEEAGDLGEGLRVLFWGGACVALLAWLAFV